VQQPLGLTWTNAGAPNGRKRVWPTLEALPLRAGSIPAAILVAGAASAIVLSEHGNRLDMLHFPVRADLQHLINFGGFLGYSRLGVFNSSLLRGRGRAGDCPLGSRQPA
jgi:hypothetical protein